MNTALLILGLAIMGDAFPDSDPWRWSLESVVSECEPDGGECVTWVTGTYPRTPNGPAEERQRFKCAEVNTYLAACYQWEDGAWSILFD